MNKEVKPLYRKVNSRTINNHHNTGPDSKNDRNTKNGTKKSMKKGVQRGLDYTPLFMFLLSKVGKDWDSIHSEAVKRLDKEEPIFYLVARNEEEKKDVVRCGESSCYSGLFIDDDNKLQKVDPNVKNEDFVPSCWCCTKTFNGKVLVKKHNFEDYNSRRI